MSQAPLLLVLSAPSGAGKTTLFEGVLARRPNLVRAITCTTRAPRVGERDGVHYHFLDEATFIRRVEAGNFLEHATVHGHRYGTLKSEVLGRLRAGRDVLLNVDVQGAANVRAAASQNADLQRALVLVFLAPPSRAVLEERLRKRGTDAEDVIQRRLAAAQRELAHWREFDYLIVSSTIAEDLRRMEAILDAEALRTGRAVLSEERLASPWPGPPE
jgi:guanylate kinase